MTDMLDKMADITVVQPIVTIKSRPHTADIDSIKLLADALLAK
jgi:hypothetical protein